MKIFLRDFHISQSWTRHYSCHRWELIYWKLLNYQLFKLAHQLRKGKKEQISNTAPVFPGWKSVTRTMGRMAHIAQIISQFCIAGNLIVKYPYNHPYCVCLEIGLGLTIVYLNFSLGDSRDSGKWYPVFGHPLAGPHNLVPTLLSISLLHLNDSPFVGF